VESEPHPVTGKNPTESVPKPTQLFTPESQSTLPSAKLTSVAQTFEPLSFSAPDCEYGGMIKSIESIDAITVRFTFCQSEPAFLAKIAFPAFGIHPQEWLESTGGGGGNNLILEKPVGTGPYVLDEWKRNEELIFSRFEDYWGEDKARIPRLVIRWNRDPSQRLLELQTGTVDGIDNVNSSEFEEIREDSSLTLVFRSALNTSYIGMINFVPPFNDERVRQAIALAIDRDMIVTDVFPEGYEVAQYFTPCAIPFGCEGEPWHEFNPENARMLLAEAGYPDGFQTEIVYRDVVRGYLPRPDLVAEALNVDVKIVSMETKEFLNAVDTGSLSGLYLLGWGGDYPDVTNFLDTHFGESASQQFGNKYPDIVGALKNGAMSIGDEFRSSFYEDANNAIRQHVPVIPLSHGGWVNQDSLAVGYQESVDPAVANPLGFETFAIVSQENKEEFVWMQESEPISLYCADETDIDSFRACIQVVEGLYGYGGESVQLKPLLAEVCDPNEEFTIWTCRLRQGVLFHDGSNLDANDVVISLVVQWDTGHDLHKGNSGEFHYFRDFWGELLNLSNK